MSKTKPIESYNKIPKTIELFGRIVSTVDDTEKLKITRAYGEARYGVNQIALNKEGTQIDELKLTYLHEMLHFILNFTGYQNIILDGKRIDIEQFIELVASGIYQYEKSAKF